MEKITTEMRDQIEDAFRVCLSDDALAKIKKQVSDIIYEIEGDIDYRIKEELAPNLAAFVSGMTDKAVNALLNGNADEMRRYLSADLGGYTGRSDSSFWPRKADLPSWHPVIHGTLFEGEQIALRRRIVDAHRDLITDQRILDLEDQVKSLVAQVNKLEAEKEGLIQRLRDGGVW
ncbi:MAG: hypothetical protein F8N37_12200 [Telmatospirillum sp.]|nr:hypothetical protein [Telmatospirillum sp.]